MGKTAPHGRSQSSLNCLMAAKFIASQVGPHPMEASPILEITIPLLRFTFLKKGCPHGYIRGSAHDGVVGKNSETEGKTHASIRPIRD